MPPHLIYKGNHEKRQDKRLNIQKHPPSLFLPPSLHLSFFLPPLYLPSFIFPISLLLPHSLFLFLYLSSSFSLSLFIPPLFHSLFCPPSILPLFFSPCYMHSRSLLLSMTLFIPISFPPSFFPSSLFLNPLPCPSLSIFFVYLHIITTCATVTTPICCSCNF